VQTDLPLLVLFIYLPKSVVCCQCGVGEPCLGCTEWPSLLMPLMKSQLERNSSEAATRHLPTDLQMPEFVMPCGNGYVSSTIGTSRHSSPQRCCKTNFSRCEEGSGERLDHRSSGISVGCFGFNCTRFCIALGLVVSPCLGVSMGQSGSRSHPAGKANNHLRRRIRLDIGKQSLKSLSAVLACAGIGYVLRHDVDFNRQRSS